MNAMTIIQIIQFLTPALQVILENEHPAAPWAQNLIRVALELLGRADAHTARHTGLHTFGATGPIAVPEDLVPPQSEWTPDGLRRFYQAQAQD